MRAWGRLKRKGRQEEAKRSTYDAREGPLALEAVDSKAGYMVHFGIGSIDAKRRPIIEAPDIFLLQRFPYF